MAKIRPLASTSKLDVRLTETNRRKTRPTLKHKPQPKDHFPDVVGYVYLSRYVKTNHVFCRFPDRFASIRTCQRHLSQLVHGSSHTDFA